MKQIKRWGIWAVGLAIIAIGLVLALRPRPALVDLAIVQEGPMQVTVDEDGVTRIRERYSVSSPLSGRLLRIRLDVGDEVHADRTVLARMEPADPSLLDPRAFAQAQARVRAAERQMESAKASLAKAEAAVDYAEKEMSRARQLRQNDAASQSEFERRELEFLQSTEDARAATFAVDIAEYELELQKAALLLADPDQSSNQEMELEIRAPIDGRVLRIHQESAAIVQAGTTLLELGDPTDLEVVADVLSRDAVRIRAGAPVRLEQWGGDHNLQGRVRLVERSGFTKISALGVEEQRVNVIIDLTGSSDQRILLGDNFRVDCRIIVWQSDRVVWLPTSALFRVGDEWHVFRVEDRRAVLTPVQIGQDNGLQAEVVEGIAVDTPVIVHPSDAIEDGAPVTQRETS
ncbi:MAG: HlyD family efflux transporter periplasmic adaptor subunit [Candidatus Paceibacterota bacterium]